MTQSTQPGDLSKSDAVIDKTGLVAQRKTELARLWREVNGSVRWPSDVNSFIDAMLAADADRARELEAAVLAERERCAKLCEQEICTCCWDDDAQAAAEYLAAEIRKGQAAHERAALDRAQGETR